MCHVPVKFTRNAFSSRDLTSSEDSSSMRSRGGMRPRPPGVFFGCTCTKAGLMVIQDKGADEVGNCVVAIAQARKTKPLSVALMPSTLLMSTSLRVLRKFLVSGGLTPIWGFLTLKSVSDPCRRSTRLNAKSVGVVRLCAECRVRGRIPSRAGLKHLPAPPALSAAPC
jgi:hypothetical protein